MKEIVSNKMLFYNESTGQREAVDLLRGESAYEGAVRQGLTTLSEEDWLKEYTVKRDAAITEIVAKGAETLATIPEDYAKLSSDVATLTEDMTAYNAYDLSLLPGINKREDESNAGVSFAWNANKASVCHVEGTATTTASANIIASTATLPEPIKAGGLYYLHFITTDPGIKARIYQYTASGYDFIDYGGSAPVHINSDTIGIIVRVNVSSGVTVNGDAEIAFLNGAPNAYLTDNAPLAATDGNLMRHWEIENQLKQNGVCRLGPGDFYVYEINMPEGSAIIGSGNATRLHFIEQISEGHPASGAAIRMATDCTVKDLQIIGAESDIAPAATVGNRHGILWQGNRSGEADNIPIRGMISGVTISNFSGGGITFNDTGYAVDASVRVSNCNIYKCGAGINIPYWAEFNTFTNVTCTDCYYGVINNGGNNCFVNCGFNRNVIGFLLDNEDDKSPNSAHGSVVGCTINHNDEAAIKIIRTYNGYVFSGIQVFDNPISIDRSMGIIFGSCEFGKEVPIAVSSGQLVLFNGCMFTTAPVLTITNNTGTIFANCFDRFGTAVSN